MTTRALNAMFNQNVTAAANCEASYVAERKAAKVIRDNDMLIESVLKDGLDVHLPCTVVLYAHTSVVCTITDWAKELDEVYDWETSLHAEEDSWMYPDSSSTDIYCNFADEELEF